MEIRVLGPVEVRMRGDRAPIPGGRQHLILAALALNPGATVTIPDLIRVVWGDDPPDTAWRQVQNGVSLLRGAVGADLLRSEPNGYRLAVEPHQVDLWRFRAGIAEGRRLAADGEPKQAAEAIRQALSLWHGPALSGLDGILADRAARLDDERLTAHEECLEHELTAGAHDILIAELSTLMAENPLRERLAATLMLALYRCGRQAEALQAYGRLSDALGAELGVLPAADLRHLYERILHEDPALTAPAGETADGSRGLVVPAQLPAEVAAFTGRQAELSRLDALLRNEDGAGEAAAVVVSAVSGTAGVGKTALAVHWAHRIAGGFPDGQLYANLRGYDPDLPISSADALARFLGALGVPEPDIPTELDERAARYRTAVARRRVLIVLDNAFDAEQVRPLLPGSPTCLVLITSRDSLAGLVSRDGVRRIDLDLLSGADAVELLRRLIGLRVDAEPEAAAALAELCARLPLALRIAAELAVAQADIPLSVLVTELSDRQRRLHLLGAGDDPKTAVSAVFSWSIAHLPAAVARVFRLAGRFPGADFDAHTLAALDGGDLPTARRHLDRLVRAHLVHRARPGRFGMHDLLRGYAIELSKVDNEDWLERLLDYHLAAAAAAMDGLHPAEAYRRPRISAPATPLPDLSDPVTARSWLDIERTCLVAIAGYALAHGRFAHPIGLSRILHRYLDGGHFIDALALHGYARQAAAHEHDRIAEAESLRSMGTAYLWLSRHEQAIDHLNAALDIFQETGDLGGQARSWNCLAIIEQMRGRPGPATEHITRALELFRRAGDLTGEADSLVNLGIFVQRQGDYPASADHLGEALALYEKVGSARGEASALNNLAMVHQRLGRHAEAAEAYERALTLNQRLGNRRGEAHAWDNLGVARTNAGRPDEATAHHLAALEVFREIGERDGEASALNGLGEAAQAVGRHGEAMARHAEALAVADQAGVLDQEARAYTGLGRVHQSQGDLDAARRHFTEALNRHTELGSPDADQVRDYLAKLTE